MLESVATIVTATTGSVSKFKLAPKDLEYQLFMMYK